MVSLGEKEECLKKLIRMSFQSGQEKEVRELLHDLLLRDTNGGKLYRFRPFDEGGYSLKNFEEGTVYCSRPSAFNDPFEAKPGMSLENMNEEVYGDKSELLSELGEKFCQIVNEEMKLEECNEHEQRVLKQFLKNEKLKEFAIKGKGQETIDIKSFLQEFIQTISGDEKLVKGIEVNAEETLRLFENISSEKLLEVTEKDSSLRWLARANGINEDTDDLGLIYLLAKKLFPEKIDEAEHRLKDIKDVQQNIYSYYEESCLMGCLCTNFKNQLMWAHYADNHKGFCIEYDYSEKDEEVLQKLPYPVIYSSNRPQVPWKAALEQTEENIDDAKEQMILTLLTKGLEWEYENEWRILINTVSSPAFKMPKVSCVYLGDRICEENRDKILEIAKKIHVPVKQMRLNSDGFGMHVEDLEM